MQTKAILSGLGVVIAGAVVWWLVSSRPEDGRGTSTTPGETSVPYDVGLAIDWTRSSGSLGDGLRSWLSEPLIELIVRTPMSTPSPTELPVLETRIIVQRLASAVSFREISQGKQKQAGTNARNRPSPLPDALPRWEAEIDLRTDVYWSDGVTLTSEHVADGFARAQQLAAEGRMQGGAEHEGMDLRNLAVREVTSHKLIVSGALTRAVLESALASRVFMPVRKDLLGAGDDPKAFLTVLGRMRLSALPTGAPDASSPWELVPNDKSYRPRPEAALRIASANPEWPK